MMTSLFEQDLATNVVVMTFPEMVDESVVELPEVERVEEAAASSVREAEWIERVEVAREEGAEEARAELQERLHESLEIERSAIAMSCASFAKARERYFAEIEGEAVKLALAIAARVLHREVAMDPTLLAGVVRVALSKLSDAEGAVLQVAAKDEEVWRKAMKASGLRVEGVAGFAAGEVQLKTMGGVAELGIEAQLVEVERGFFDLLAKRPA